MKIQNWIACVQDRGKWKEVVGKAKTFNERKFSARKKNIQPELEATYYNLRILHIAFSYRLYVPYCDVKVR